MAKPAHKKRELIQESQSDNNSGSESEREPCPDFRTRQHLLAEEFDLEIELRKRLAATIESRVTWALILQEALSNDITKSTSGNFENAAVAAIEVIETPCNILFDRDPTPPQNIHDLLERGSRASVASESGLQPKSRTRKPRTSRVRPQPHGAKLLFIRNTTVSPPTVAKMVCPDCGKFDFTNLQGLLNHARLRHQREYGTHDECMQTCAVIVDEDGEAEWVVKNGIELSGVSVPSVRRLFEIAVGDDRGFIGRFRVGAEENDEDAEVISSTYLSKTLGHHKDTPALAPFLGRAPKRRCINVYAHDEEVDIDDFEVTSKPPWRMSFPHRNKARPELDVVAVTPTAPESRPEAEPNAQLADVPNNTAGTRFHIIARVVISDRSLWIPPERRAQALPNHTHRWIVEVNSPSYSLHISAFLTKLTITCITETPPSTLKTPLTIEEPPFVISSTTDKPFLAKVTLTWVGHQNVPMEVEHWVELDPFHTSIVNPVLGDEQVLDVELDRHTELLPIRQVSAPGTRKRKGDETIKSSEESTIAGRSSPQDEPYYMTTLKSLLPRYPMTMKDVKGRTSVHHIQYKLVSTPNQLMGLIHGRRKAIEWGRARALRDAYQAIIASGPPSAVEDTIPLTTADVFRWLEDEGHFSRPVVDMTVKIPSQDTKKAKPNPAPTSPHACLCSVCGLNHQPILSTSAMKAESTTTADAPAAACKIVHDMTNWHRMSMIDVRRPLGLLSSSIPDHPSNTHLVSPSVFTSPDLTLYIPTEIPSISQLLYSPRDLVATANPELSMAIRDIVQPLRLVCFDRLSPRGLLLDHRGTKSQVEAQVAPYALLASLTKTFVHLLVRSGLDAANLDMSMATAKAKAEGRGTRKSKQPRDRLLTPSHIIRGVTGGSNQHSRPLAAASLFLARLGSGVSSQPITMTTRAPSGEVAMKVET